MPDFRLDADLEQLRSTVEQFTHDVIAPSIGELYEAGAFPYAIVEQMGRMGLFGLPIPEEYGGAGMDNICYAIAMEEIARACASTAVIMSVNNSLACDPILKFGTEDQKKQYLVPLASGKKLDRQKRPIVRTTGLSSCPDQAAFLRPAIWQGRRLASNWVIRRMPERPHRGHPGRHRAHAEENRLPGRCIQRGKQCS